MLPKAVPLTKTSGEKRGVVEEVGRSKEYTVTWVEICKQYPGQWVLIEYQKLDEQLNVVEGEVVAHSPTKEDLYKQLLQTKGKNIAIEYSGELPQDLAVMFAVWPGTS